MIKLSDYVIKLLKENGVKDVFMFPGGGCMHLMDSLGREKNINYICNLHEQACAIATEAYAQYTGNIGVTLVTTGPGGTNTVTGVAAAWIDSTPCIFLSGQVKTSALIGNSGVRQMGVQEVDIVSIVKSITKYAVTVFKPETIRYHLEKALYLARFGRPGPVWIDIPLDIQASTIDENDLVPFDPNECRINTDSSGLKQKVGTIYNLINNSKRPVILVGNGVRLAKAKDEFLKLIEALNIPVLTTWKTIDFFDENHPLYFGRPGSIGQRNANFIQQNSDLIITVGARLDFPQIGHDYSNFAKHAKKVIVDIDSWEINKIKTNIDIPIRANASDFIFEMLNSINLLTDPSFEEWISVCRNWKTKYPVMQDSYREQKDFVNSYVLLDVLSNYMSENDVLVPGSSGACSEVSMQSFKVKKGQRVLNNQGLGSMGFGLPASIGACIASGKNRTICINGDGGFQLNIQELETVARLNLPIKFFILNNQGYASIRNTQNNYFGSYYVASSVDSGVTLANTMKVADCYGIKGVQIFNHDGLENKVAEILDYPGPVICEVMISPSQQTMPRVSSFIKEDGTMESRPFEDLWPFLDRDEFNENMRFVNEF